MNVYFIILAVLVLLVLMGGIVLAVVLMRWMKRRDAAQAELLKRMLERQHELDVLRDELLKRNGK